MSEFSPALIGQTEKALNAILERSLAGMGVSEPQWVGLRVTAMSESDGELDREALAVRLSRTFGRGEAHASAVVDELVAAGLVGGQRSHAGDALRS